MKSQTVLPKKSTELKQVLQDTFSYKKPLKVKNFTFARNWSLKLKKDIKIQSVNHRIELQNKHHFIPKLKSKQLLREPKFFFSLQRKKQKNQFSEPSFQQVKCFNPEMKGSKTKSFYSNVFCKRKTSSFQNDSISKIPSTPNKTLNKKLFSYTSQATRIKDEQQTEAMTRNFSYTFEDQNIFESKTLKRPNLNENISFLIRRKKETKSKMTLMKINESKKKMSHFFANFQQNKI